MNTNVCLYSEIINYKLNNLLPEKVLRQNSRSPPYLFEPKNLGESKHNESRSSKVFDKITILFNNT